MTCTFTKQYKLSETHTRTFLPLEVVRLDTFFPDTLYFEPFGSSLFKHSTASNVPQRNNYYFRLNVSVSVWNHSILVPRSFCLRCNVAKIIHLLGKWLCDLDCKIYVYKCDNETCQTQYLVIIAACTWEISDLTFSCLGKIKV